MSTFLQDLDFFDVSIFESEVPTILHSDVVTKSKGDMSEEKVTENEDERNRSGVKESKSLENNQEFIVKKKHDDSDLRFVADHVSDKEEESADKFTTALWSDENSITSRSHHSWELPSGTIPWDDKDKPMVLLLNYADLTLTKDEENGLLTDRIIAACSSYLTETPGNKCHVAAKVSLNNKNLNDIRILGYHRFLQYVDLSWNNLSDLTPLGCIPYLMYLDVSHNLMEEVLRFRPPLNLTYVNYSYNQVWQIDDLTDFWTISYLNLSHNKISKIQGLHNLRYLRHLDLSHNKIECFENLNNLRLTDLNLEYNLISKYVMEPGEELQVLPNLTNLHLNNNIITTLQLLKDVYHLKRLDLHGNNIADLIHLNQLKHLKNLRQLDMSGNPVACQKPYRSLLLNILPELKFLDQTEIDISERVAACRNQRFDLQLEAARHSARIILLEQLNDTGLGLDVLPIDQASYPFVILVGPSASSKKYIISDLAEKYSEKVYLGKLHTTRKVLESENHLLYHTTREEFEEMTKSGKFLCVSEHLGHFYAFSRDELAAAVKEHKLCLTAMDMVGALTVHTYGIRPFLILAILQSEEEHKKRLKMTYGPVASAIGAAYIAQRQLVNTHGSNVKRIKMILDDLLKSIFADVLKLEDDLKSDENFKVNGECQGASTFRNVNAVNSPSPFGSDSSSVFVCYNRKESCYPCSPGTCGFQTCMNAASEVEASDDAPDASKRVPESNCAISAEQSTTSYSAKDTSINTMEFPSFDESSSGDSYGEHDPFADWSMAFIEWSEVNLSALQLEEAAEVLCEKYIEGVMSTRDVYQNLHLENPGLFSLSIFTDNIPTAVKEVAKFLRKVWRETPTRKPSFDIEDDIIYKAFIPKKQDQYKEILTSEFLSSGDGASQHRTKVASAAHSPSSISREMRLKGYGDSCDDLL